MHQGLRGYVRQAYTVLCMLHHCKQPMNTVSHRNVLQGFVWGDYTCISSPLAGSLLLIMMVGFNFTIYYDCPILNPSRSYTTELGFGLANGSTPLHVAAELNRTHAAKAILKYHASRIVSRNIRVPLDVRWVRDCCGRTPYQVPTKGGCRDMKLQCGVHFIIFELTIPYSLVSLIGHPHIGLIWAGQSISLMQV